MAKKRRQKKHKKQSLQKNIALFCLSLCLLVGASIWLSTISDKADLPFNPLQHRWGPLVATTEEPAVPEEQPSAKDAQKSSVGGFEYSFYDILYHQDHSDATGDHHYSIQIASFKSKDRAMAYRDKLQKKHRLRCRVKKKGSWYVVRWGSFPTRAAADRYNTKICRMLDRDCMIVRM